MADIFISHSGSDNDLADTIGQWLARDRESWSVFLDKDPRGGILAGQSWQDRLQRELQSCRLVIAIVTPSWLGSNWCFTEAVAATFRGKDFIAVLPVALSEADLKSAPPIVHERQRQPLDLATGAGWDDLLHALDRSGLDPDQWFPIPKGVGPYPGFVAFEERDAGVYFGRDQEITQYLDDLSLLRTADRAQLMVISGGSGSGKSSLLKAGLIPRLRRRSDWLVLPPFDPSREPVHALWASLRMAYQATGTDFAAVPAPPREAGALADALGDALRVLEEASGAWLLLPLDQAEVLLAGAQHGGNGPADGAVLLDAVGRLLAARSRKLVAVLTIRTEFMPALERGLPPAVRLQDRSLRPIAGLSEIIEKPAARFGIDLEDGLTGLMVEETHGAEALPLLAYTLRELYERYGGDNLLTVEEYVALGRVEGAIRRKVREVFSDPAPRPEETAAFRRCVVRHLVRVDRGAVEGERYLRSAVKREALPQGAARLIDRLLEARLLVGGGDDTVAIAHERFIADWPDAPLRRWLAEDRSDRELIESLKSRMAEHADGGPLLAGKPLLDARDFAARDPALREDEPELFRFIAESEAAERRRQIRRRLLLGGAVAASLVFFAVAVGAILFYLEAQKQTLSAERNEKAANAQRDRARFAQGVRLLERSDAEWARGDTLDAKISACLAVGFEGCGRETADAALEERFPVLITAEHEAERTHARRTILQHPGYRLVWQSPISRHHDGPIDALAYNQSGALLATAGDDAKVKLWDTKSGAEVAELTGHTSAVSAVAFAEQAGLLVTAGHDRTLRLWSLETHQEIATLWGHANWITSVDVASSGAYAVSGGWDDVKIWDLKARRELVSLGIHRQGGSTVALNPSGSVLAVSGQFGDSHDVQLFEVPSGRPLRGLDGQGAGADAIAFSPDGTLVAAAGQIGAVFVWRVDDGKRVAALQFPGEVEGLAFDRDSSHIAVAGGRVGLWDIVTGELVWMPPSESTPATAVAVSPDGSTVAAAGENGFVSLWQPASGEVTRSAGHVGAVDRVAVSPDGRLIASAGPDGLRLWNAVTGRPGSFAGGQTDQRGGIIGLAFSPNARWLAAAYKRGELVVFNATTRTEFALLTDLDDSLSGIAFSADSRLLFLAGRKLSVWDVSSRKLHASAKPPPGIDRLDEVAPLADGKRIVTGSQRGALIWTVADLAEPAPPWGGAVAKLAVSPDGSAIALAGGDDGTIKVARPESIDDPKTYELLEGHEERIVDLAYSPSGGVLASASTDGTIRLWRDNRPYLVIPVGPVPPTSVAFSADGSLLLSGRADGALQLWRLPDDQERLRIANLPGKVREAKLSPDGRYLATLSGLSLVGHNAFQLWDARTGRETASFNTAFSGSRDDNAQPHLAFSADGAKLAVGGRRELNVLDTATGSRTEVPLEDRSLVGFAFEPDGALLVATKGDPGAAQADVRRIVLEGSKSGATPLDTTTPPKLAGGQVLASSRESGYRLWGTYDLAALGVEAAVRDILKTRQTNRLYLSPAFDVLGWAGNGLWIWDAAETRLVRRFDSGWLSGDGKRVFQTLKPQVNVFDAVSGAQVDEYSFESGDSTGLSDAAADTVVFSGTDLGIFESGVTVDYTSYLDIADVGDRGIVWRSTTANLRAPAGGRHFSPPPWSLSGGALYIGPEASDGKPLFWRLVDAGDIDGAIHLLETSPLLAAPGSFDDGKAWLLTRMLGKELHLDGLQFDSIGELVDFKVDEAVRDKLQRLSYSGIIDARHYAALPTEWLKYLLKDFGTATAASVAEHLNLEKALSLSRWFEKRTPKTAIALAEAATKAAPGDGRAYSRRGYARARSGDLDGAVADFEEAVSLAKGANASAGEEPRLAAALYDLACGFSLQAAALATEPEKSAATAHALERLSEAVTAGYDDWDHMTEDRDLAAVRADPGFEARLAAWKSGTKPD